ncbi:hypothetical protein ACFE04_003953 [Oxalis oulophora]
MKTLLLVVCSCFIVLAAMTGSVEAEKQFEVGGSFRWREPIANNSDMFSLWASRNRFQVGDTLSFKYENDSVLVVDKWDYYHCNTTDPIASFDNGETVIKLDRPGPFYFISAAIDHCKNGQRLLVEVLGFHKSLSPVGSPLESEVSPTSARSSSALVSVALSLVFVALIFSVLSFLWCAP